MFYVRLCLASFVFFTFFNWNLKRDLWSCFRHLLVWVILSTHLDPVHGVHMIQPEVKDPDRLIHALMYILLAASGRVLQHYKATSIGLMEFGSIGARCPSINTVIDISNRPTSSRFLPWKSSRISNRHPFSWVCCFYKISGHNGHSMSVVLKYMDSNRIAVLPPGKLVSLA